MASLQTYLQRFNTSTLGNLIKWWPITLDSISHGRSLHRVSSMPNSPCFPGVPFCSIVISLQTSRAKKCILKKPFCRSCCQQFRGKSPIYARPFEPSSTNAHFTPEQQGVMRPQSTPTATPVWQVPHCDSVASWQLHLWEYFSQLRLEIITYVVMIVYHAVGIFVTLWANLCDLICSECCLPPCLLTQTCHL